MRTNEPRTAGDQIPSHGCGHHPANSTGSSPKTEVLKFKWCIDVSIWRGPIPNISEILVARILYLERAGAGDGGITLLTGPRSIKSTTLVFRRRATSSKRKAILGCSTVCHNIGLEHVENRCFNLFS